MLMRTLIPSLFAIIGWACSSLANAESDPVVYSFAFVGCNRLDGAGVDATGFASTANEAQLLQTFKDVGSLDPKPQTLFLLGDIVRGLKKGVKKLGNELDAWKTLIKDQVDSSIRLVVLTGNHEMLKKQAADAEDTEDEVEVPNKPAYAYWQQNMRPFIFGEDGPGTGGADKLVNDEKRLSYTFQDEDNLFVIVNTDSQIDDRSIGVVPLNWLKAKLKAAQTDKQIRNIFVIGHKPIVSPDNTVDASGARTIRESQAEAFYSLLNKPAKDQKSSKVRAYLSAHAHEWKFFANLAEAKFTGNLPQIVAGNGGSPPDSNWKDQYFGFTVIAITKSGKISAQSYGRPIPQPNYYAQSPPPDPATAQGEVIILSSHNEH